jgi:hypothetical protein
MIRLNIPIVSSPSESEVHEFFLAPARVMKVTFPKSTEPIFTSCPGNAVNVRSVRNLHP